MPASTRVSASSHRRTRPRQGRSTRTTIEIVPRDLASACRAFLEALDVRFEHAEANSDSHFLTSLFGQSQTLLIRDGELDLGRWQGVFLAEFDGPRSRTVRVAVS